MKKQKRGIKQDNHWTYKLIGYGIIMLGLALLSMFSGCRAIDWHKVADVITDKAGEIQEPADGTKPSVVDPAPSDFYSQMVWVNGPNGSQAKVTKKLYEFNMVSKDFMTFRADSVGDWSYTINDKDKTKLHGYSCIAVYQDGEWRGGKFDWVRADTRSRDFKNVHKGYLRITPRSGDRVRFFILNRELTQASNYLENIWP